MRRVYEDYASGRFQNWAEVKRYLEAQPAYPKADDGSIRWHEVGRLLTRRLYSGHLEYALWNLPRQKPHHAPIISLETFEKVQERRAGRAPVAPARPDL